MSWGRCRCKRLLRTATALYWRLSLRVAAMARGVGIAGMGACAIASPWRTSRLVARGAPPRSGRARTPRPRSRPHRPAQTTLRAAARASRRVRLVPLLATWQLSGQHAARLPPWRCGRFRGWFRELGPACDRRCRFESLELEFQLLDLTFDALRRLARHPPPAQTPLRPSHQW